MKGLISKKIDIKKQNNFYNNPLYDVFEMEYTNETLDVNIITSGEYKRDININFKFDGSGNHTSLIKISTEDYIHEGAFCLNAYGVDSIFVEISEDGTIDNTNLVYLANMICAYTLEYIVLEEADTRFHNDEQRRTLLYNSLEFYVQNMNCKVNELSEILEDMLYSRINDISENKYDTNIARPFGPSKYIEKHIVKFNEKMIRYNDIFEEILEDKHFIEYMLETSENFKKMYKDITATRGNIKPNAAINYFVLDNKGVYLLNNLYCSNFDTSSVDTFMENNKYDCLVAGANQKLDIHTFDKEHYPIYHIGDSKSNYIELHIKETEEDYCMRIGKYNLGYYDMKVSKNHLEDTYIVLDSKGYMFTREIDIVEDKTFDFIDLETDYSMRYNFDLVEDIYNKEEYVNNNINIEEIKLDNDFYREENSYNPLCMGLDMNMEIQDFEDDEIPF